MEKLRTADYMRHTRENRIKRRECTRCGAPLPSDGYTTCPNCRAYMMTYKHEGIPEKTASDKHLAFERQRHRVIENPYTCQLFSAMVLLGYTPNSLSQELDISVRTIQRWLYKGKPPNQRNFEKMREFFLKADIEVGCARWYNDPMAEQRCKDFCKE